MAKAITSPANPRVKWLVRLRERRARDAEGVALVEGVREVERALAAGWNLRLLATCPDFSAAAAVAAGLPRTPGTERLELGRAAFAKVSGRENPDGVLALVEPPSVGLDAIPWRNDGLYLVADGLEKPGNLGALLRSADAANVDAVFVTGRGTDLNNPQVVRASMGSVFALPVLAIDAGPLLAQLRIRRVRLVVTSPQADLELWDADLTGTVAIAVGTEHTGLSPAWLTAADAVVRVPMAGMADSLNVATTGALLLFEARRQRRG